MGILPASGIIDEVRSLLLTHNRLVITAPPGAGKSTLLPPAMLDVLPGNEKIIMLEPRRLAASAIADRMAEMMGEQTGGKVGYRIRFENRVSKATRIEVVTERILTRVMIEDPTLDGVGIIIFDEFHERSLDSDLALSIALQTQKDLRPDLRIVLMSATIDADDLCRRIGAANVSCEGRMFPVGTFHLPSTPPDDMLTDSVVDTVRKSLGRNEGDILVFLPGEAEIHRCAAQLASCGAEVHLLYGNLPRDEQRKAISPSPPGGRKVVLSTNIAETSLTIEGVRVVVDTGLFRRNVYNPLTGMSLLSTGRISLDMASQRSGRAGRTAPGVCYRLWSKGTEAAMTRERTPAILCSDLSGMLLDICAWGGCPASELPWITPPEPSAMRLASSLLESLGAIDARGRITPKGRRMSSMPCHPRIASMLMGTASDKTAAALASDIAAILEERDPMPGDRRSGIAVRVDAFRADRRVNGNKSRSQRMCRAAAQYRAILRADEDNGAVDPYEVGELLAQAFPERIGLATSQGHYLLADGSKAYMDAADPLAACRWIVAAAVAAKAGAEGRICLAGALAPEDALRMAVPRKVVSWDARAGKVLCQEELRIGRLTVRSRPAEGVTREQTSSIIARAAVKDGLSMFSFDDAVGDLQRRIGAVCVWHPELRLPDVSTPRILSMAQEWLPAYIGEAKTTAELRKIDMCAVVWGLLDPQMQHSVDRIAPSHIVLPNGHRVRVEYRQGAELPIVRVRLQECFGMTETPSVDGGRRKVLMELLSPGFKPVQLTSDLGSFWRVTYQEVRKELRRRYPRHNWPENPL